MIENGRFTSTGWSPDSPDVRPQRVGFYLHCLTHNCRMPNIASVLKAEIVRLARKELRTETEALRKGLASARSEIASLKRRTVELERALKSAARTSAKAPRAPVGSEPRTSDASFRFRAAGMASNRKRLGLSAADFGMLVGATGQSVYAWEARKSKPSGKSLAAIAALRGIGKREVARRLALLKEAA